MFLLRRTGLFFALLAGVVTSQLPEFAQQYRQRLGGAIDELQRFMDNFDQDVKSRSLTRAQGIETLMRNPDPLVAQRAHRLRETETRLAKLKDQNETMKDAGSFRRIAVMVNMFDPFIARRTYQFHEPAVPLNMEGLVTALAGFFAGLGLWKFFAWPIKTIRARRRKFAGATI